MENNFDKSVYIYIYNSNGGRHQGLVGACFELQGINSDDDADEGRVRSCAIVLKYWLLLKWKIFIDFLLHCNHLVMLICWCIF